MYSLTRNCALVLAVALVLCAAVAGAEEAPRLDGVKLQPTSGDTNTLFTFLIVYHGATTPTTRLLYLDTKSYAMTSCGAAPMGGTMYRYQTKLTAGTHKYRFRFVAGTQTVLAPGPAETNWYTSFSVKQGATFSLAGVVTCDGVGLAGVGLRLTRPGDLPVIARTDSTGHYTVKGLAPGTWCVTPSLTGFTFTPTAANVALPPSKTNCNFTATRVRQRSS
jgi:hypothetical protein